MDVLVRAGNGHHGRVFLGDAFMTVSNRMTENKKEESDNSKEVSRCKCNLHLPETSSPSICLPGLPV